MLGRPILALMVTLVSACSSTGNANYPPLTHAFGKIEQSGGAAEVIRESMSVALRSGDAVYVGDEILVRSDAAVSIVLESGQRVELSGSTRWSIDKAASNGAAFGSQTSLQSGSLEVSGQEYMPHTLKIVTPLAEVSTFSENFRLTLDATQTQLTVQALDATPVTVKNADGELAMETALAVAIVEGRSPPRIK